MAKRASKQVVDPSGLNAAQVETLRARLVQARADAVARLREEEATARSSESLPEPMDAAELSREQGDAALLVELTRARLRDIDDALLKIEGGRYGISERSGEPIGFDRLMALPWARLGVDEE